MKKVWFALTVFLVAFAIPVTVYSIVRQSGDFDVRDKAAETDSTAGDSENVSIPVVESIPSTEARVGEKYSYKVRASDSDGNELEFRMQEHPAWLTWNADLLLVEGIPTTADIGTASVEILVSDGKWLKRHTFSIVVMGDSTEATVVEPDTIEDVQGISDARVQGNSRDAASTGNSDEYGLYDGSGGGTADRSANGDNEAVLGVSDQLPDTGILPEVKLWFGVGIVALGLFLIADVRWNISGNLFSRVQYEQGKQIEMEVGNGLKIKKRKIRI